MCNSVLGTNAVDRSVPRDTRMDAAAEVFGMGVIRPCPLELIAA